MGLATLVRQRPAGHTLPGKILTFSNGCILVTIGSIYTKLEDFVTLGVLFQTMWINMNVVPRSTKNNNGETEN